MPPIAVTRRQQLRLPMPSGSPPTPRRSAWHRQTQLLPARHRDWRHPARLRSAAARSQAIAELARTADAFAAAPQSIRAG
ncbi:hypothetical protein XarbCFBP8150_21400, partial [Xanthomonas arboricola]